MARLHARPESLHAIEMRMSPEDYERGRKMKNRLEFLQARCSLAEAALGKYHPTAVGAKLTTRPSKPRITAGREVMVDNAKKRICTDEAFAAYMAQGPSRSLSRLLKQYRAQTGVIPPAMSTLKRWSASDTWQARAREHDSAVQGEASKRAIEREADQRVEVSQVVEDTYRDVLGHVRQHLAKMPQIKTPSMILELVSAAGLLHGQLIEIQRGKMPDQAFLEKIVQHLSGAGGKGGDPSDDEMQRILDLAMAKEPVH